MISNTADMPTNQCL